MTDVENQTKRMEENVPSIIPFFLVLKDVHIMLND